MTMSDINKNTFYMLLELLEYNEDSDTFAKDYSFSFATQSLMSSTADENVKAMNIPKISTAKDLSDVIEVATINRYTLLYYPATNSKATSTRNIMIDIDKFDLSKLEELKSILEQLDILKYVNICKSGGGLHLYIILKDGLADVETFNDVKCLFAIICRNRKIKVKIDNSINLSSRFRSPLSLNTKYDDNRRVICIHRGQMIEHFELSKIIDTHKESITKFKNIMNKTNNKNVSTQKKTSVHTNSNTNSNSNTKENTKGKLYSHWTNVLTKIIDRNNGNRNVGVYNTFLKLIFDEIITDTATLCKYISLFISDDAFRIYFRKDNNFTKEEVEKIAEHVYNYRKSVIKSVDLSGVKYIPAFLGQHNYDKD
jgi:hypothetical protein